MHRQRPHSLAPSVVIVALAAGCVTGPSAAPAPSSSAAPVPGGVRVEVAKVTASAPYAGKIRIADAPGAVGVGATTVTLTVVRELTPPVAFSLLHLNGNDLPVTSTFATIRADGGFDEVETGDPERPVHTGDELNVSPYNGLRLAGPPKELLVP